MRIGIDATSICRKRTGIEYHTLYLVENILKEDKENHYSVFFRDKFPFHIEKYQRKHTFLVSPLKNQVLCEQIWLPYAAIKERVDIMLFPGFPPGMLTFKPFLMTIFDSTLWKFPEFLSWKARIYLKPLTLIALRRATRIITISETSKNDIGLYIGKNSSKLINNGIAISPDFKIIKNQELLEKTRRKYCLPKHLILSVGSLEPRKNQLFLFKVFKKICEQYGKERYSLVLAGRKAWGKRSVLREIGISGLENQVHFTGYVPKEDLINLYNLADIFVFPSIYEGFGLPILEAMACGLPVVASNISVHRELFHSTVLLADPNNVDSFVDGIKKLLNNSQLKKDLVEKGLLRSELFSWKNVALDTIKIFKFVEEQKPGES